MKYYLELTDLFGGEANYSWVRKGTIEAPENVSDSLLIRKAKKAFGLCGRHKKHNLGETLGVYFNGIVLFIIPAE